MGQRTVIIEVSADGNDVTYDAVGFQGTGCKQALKDFERHVTLEEGDREYKPEYKQQVNNATAKERQNA